MLLGERSTIYCNFITQHLNFCIYIPIFELAVLYIQSFLTVYVSKLCDRIIENSPFLFLFGHKKFNTKQQSSRLGPRGTELPQNTCTAMQPWPRSFSNWFFPLTNNSKYFYGNTFSHVVVCKMARENHTFYYLLQFLYYMIIKNTTQLVTQILETQTKSLKMLFCKMISQNGNFLC